ncbi:MAG: DUF3168 domain-containing protein [Bryobacteraceae bacterium]
MIDSAVTLRALIAAQSSIAALVSTHVYVDRLPAEPTFPAITLQSAGASEEEDAPIQDAEFEVRVWGETHAAARAVLGAMKDALHGRNNLTVGSVAVYYVGMESGPVTMADPDTEWLYLATRWRMVCEA